MEGERGCCEQIKMEQQRRASPPLVVSRRSPKSPLLLHPQSDLVCDIFSDIMTLAEVGVGKAGERGGDSDEDDEDEDDGDARLTFPQIWVEGFCESSDDDDEAAAGHLLQRRQRAAAATAKKKESSPGGPRRSKDKVLRSLLLTSCSTDVSFEGSLSSSSSGESGHGSFQLNSRENSVESGLAASSSSRPSSGDDGGQPKHQPPDPPPPPPPHPFRSPTAALVHDWLARVERHGFGPAVLQAFSSDEINTEEEDDTWFERGLVRVFDPYYDLDAEDIRSVEGRVDAKSGLPLGRCTVALRNGDELFATFRGGLRQGRGSVEGANLAEHGLVALKGFYTDSVLTGRGIAILAPGGMCDVTVQLEGVFNDGYLEGPVRGVDARTGALVFAGRYARGLPVGPCWLAREGQGWLHGAVDGRGRFTGDDIAFVYPDGGTCLVGRFEEEVMVAAARGRITAAATDDAGVLRAAVERRPGAQRRFSFSPSDSKSVHCERRLRDPFEAENAACAPSEISGAGDGLFARRDLPAGAVVAYYNGLKIEHGEQYSSDSDCNYEIYVDWNFTEKSAFVDIPLACVDAEDYCASLAHKANHSFDPNVQFVSAAHPRFGRVPALKTIRDVAAGEEVLTHYKYDMALAPTWYTEAYRRFSGGGEYSDEEGCPEGPEVGGGSGQGRSEC